MKHTVAAALLAAAGLSCAADADARGGITYVVTGLGEPATIGSKNCVGTNCPTLRDAVNTVVAGDTINFASALDGKTILLSLSSNGLGPNGAEFGPSAFFLSAATVVVDGTGHNVTIARDTSQPAFRLFDVDPVSSLTLIGVTLRDGLAQGGSSNAGGGALGAGGAIFNQGSVVLTSSTLTANTAQGGSGGLPFGGGAAGGAGVGQDTSTLDGAGPNGGVSGSPPANGGFGGGGGATIDTNSPGGNGGFGGGGGKGSGSTVAGTGGFGGGGGGDAFQNGRGGFGAGDGGGDTDHAPAGGGGGGMGGAIFNDAGMVTATNTTFYANNANGGGTSYGGQGAAGGNGSGLGGAIFNYAGTVNLSFSTLAANAAAAGTGGDNGAGEGGAIYSYGDTGCGLGDGNVCGGGTAAVTLVNTIASNSKAAHDIVIDGTAGSSTGTGSGNLVGLQSGFGGTFSSSDPKLGALAPNGGAPHTVAIGATSPAHDAAPDCLDVKSATVSADERGRTRPQGASCDIGAYEYDGDYIFANSYD